MEPLLTFKRGAVVHFAMSDSDIRMTTRLAGHSTFFLPFNRGNDGAAGNPSGENGHYLLARNWPPNIAKFCQTDQSCAMTTMNIPLPGALKSFVDEQVNQGGYGNSSEYVRELIRKDQDRQHLRGIMLAGAASAPTRPVDSAYFDNLRDLVRGAKKGSTGDLGDKRGCSDQGR